MYWDSITTSDTTWLGDSSDIVTVTTSYAAGAYEEVFDVPAWWRWFDMFRIWIEPIFILMMMPMLPILTAPSNAESKRQRARKKRRMFIQKLYATA